MRLDDLIVEVRDKGLSRLGRINNKDLKLECYPAYNGVGTWKLTLPSTHQWCSALRTPGSGLVITLGSQVIMSGPMQTAQSTLSTDALGEVIEFNGLDDNVILSNRLAYPNPTSATGTARYQSKTGITETLMYAFVKDNLGPSGIAARRIDQLAFAADQARGTSTTKQVRYDTLLTVLTDLAAIDGLGFRTYQSDGQYLFEVYQPADRTTLVRLSVNNNSLASQTSKLVAPATTKAVVGSTDDTAGASVTEVVSTDPDTWGPGMYVETFVSQEDSNTVAARTALGQQALTDGAGGVSVQGVPTDTTNMVYGTDWNLGDMVSVIQGDAEWPLQVSGVALKADNEGVLLGVVIGDEGAFDAGADRAVAATTNRVSVLERKGTPYAASIRAITAATTTRAVLSSEEFINASGTITLTLPNPSTWTAGRQVTIKNSGTGTVTVSTSAGTIDAVTGTTTKTLATKTFATFVANGATWLVV